jgi:hypothetical protein
MNQFTQEAVHEELLNIWRKEHKRESKSLMEQLFQVTEILRWDLLGGVSITVSAQVMTRRTYYTISPTNDWTMHNGQEIECKIRRYRTLNYFNWAISAQYKQ